MRQRSHYSLTCPYRHIVRSLKVRIVKELVIALEEFMIVRFVTTGYSPNCVKQITFIFINDASLVG